ncbi:MAG: PHP domain-containing protein [Patescibacteria group bacterium]|jgi:hypothetical protein
MKFPYDLHVHSTHSDGDYNPSTVAKYAKDSGLEGVVLTDHNSVEGFEEFFSACDELELDTFMGVEISTIYKEVEIHVLGYANNFDLKIIRNKLQFVVESYNQRIRKVIKLLQGTSETKLDFDQIRQTKSKFDSITKYDIAKALCGERGWPPTKQLQLLNLMNRGGHAFVPYSNDLYSPHDACKIIKQAGGVCVLAHPAAYIKKTKPGLDKNQIEELIKELIEIGLIGLEAHYPAYTPEQEQYICGLAKRFNLITVGGSDWHGPYHHPERIFGMVGTTQEEFEAIKELIK